MFAAAFFDGIAVLRPQPEGGHNFQAIGYWLVILGALGSFGAVFTGLALSKWVVGGTGSILRHHIFVWPAFGLIVGLGAWRFLVGPRPARSPFIIYIAILLLACGLIGAAGFFGGEMLLGK